MGKIDMPVHDDTKLPALTGLRFLAALAVLISHFDHRTLISVPEAVIDFLDGGRTAVSLFFVLSGFILTYNYADMSGRTERIKFYASRVARIYPVTLLALGLGAIGVLFAIATPGSGALMEWYALDEATLFNIGGSFLAQLTVLTGWLPTASLNQPWNSPAWSISCEVFFYALFPVLIIAMRKMRLRRLVMVLLGSFALQCLIIWGARAFAPTGQKGFLVSQFPLTHLFEFVAGIAAALFFLRGGGELLRRGQTRNLFLAGSLIPLALLAYFRPVDPAYLLMSPLFAVLILALAVPPARRPSALAWQPLVLLGEASFSLYMIHVPLMNLFSIPNPAPWVGWLILAATVGLSVLVFKSIETPARFRVRAAILSPARVRERGAGSSRRKRINKNLVALGVLAVLAAAAGGAALSVTLAPAPVSASVASYKPTPQATVEPVNVAVFGDSYAVGVGAGDKALGWVYRLSWNQQWGVTNIARGGTGYTSAFINDPAQAQAACSLEVCPNYAGMIAEAVAAAPTVVIVSGGRNDAWVDAATEDTAIQAFYAELRAALPTVKIIAFNPLWDSSEAPESLPLISASVRAAVESVGGQYLDVGQPLAGKPELMAADGKHPNGIGHLAIFEAKVRMLQSAGLAV